MREDFDDDETILEQVFRPHSSTRRQSRTHAALGALAIVAAIVGMAFAIGRNVDTMTLHFCTTLPTILGVGALTSAWKLSRAPESIAIGSAGISVEKRGSEVSYPWNQIGWATLKDVPLGSHKALVVYDVNGKTLFEISDAFKDFKRLAELVRQRVDANPDTTAESLRRKKSKRSGIYIITGAAFAFAMAMALIWFAYDKQRETRLLAEAAVPGEAEITSRRLAPNGVTPVSNTESARLTVMHRRATPK